MFSRLVKRKQVNQRVTALQNRMFRTAYAWCHDRTLAQDLAQEAALKAIEHASQLNDLKAVDAWIFTILSNCHRAHLRKLVQTDEFDEDRKGSIESNLLPDRISEISGLVDQVKIAIEGLNEEQRKVITLVDIEEFSYAEVASILGVPIGTVMSRLSRARQQLKKRLLSNSIHGGASVSYLKRNSSNHE
jgi:RNA polymerase sigma-70 factor (ECF subfamily)